ncbi:trehalose-6-phosphate synthase [bacterium]|nr:trehalose-6-phosphate synthase [bacterium]
MIDREGSETRRLVVVSNRLPIILKRSDKGEWTIKRGSGGLVTALAPVLMNRGGLWIGWIGTVGKADISRQMDAGTVETGYTLKPVKLTQTDIDDYYYGFSNEIIWPLFHDLISLCEFKPKFWTAYKRVNQKFAAVISRNTIVEDFVWVHDYHLMLVARYLRDSGIRRKIGFFLHIPFPQLDIFLKLPWRFEILRGLLDYDLIGFQTVRDKRNFIQCVRALIRGIRVEGAGQVSRINLPEREIRVGNFPISIDYNAFAEQAASKEVADEAWFIHENLPKRQIILGIDRLDYTKGIPLRLNAFRNALERYPDLRGKVTLVQVVVPSRKDIDEYNDLKMEIERLIGEINGQFTLSGWMPIIYLFRSLRKIELLAYYRTAEIALITPLKDGMNLVAKEFCACSLEENSVLIMSEFAGAAAQMQRGALLVNPYDTEGVADAIYRAFKMGKEERKSRMKRLRRTVQRYNIFWWVNSFLNAAITKSLDSFPALDYYMPQMKLFDDLEHIG